MKVWLSGVCLCLVSLKNGSYPSLLHVDPHHPVQWACAGRQEVGCQDEERPSVKRFSIKWPL